MMMMMALRFFKSKNYRGECHILYYPCIMHTFFSQILPQNSRCTVDNAWSLLFLYECNRGYWGSVLVCLKPKSVAAESDKSVGVKDLFVCVKQT